MTKVKPGAILAYNRTWRLGMHYDYIFFKVDRLTAKGNIMGKYLRVTCTTEAWDHDAHTARWCVDPMCTSGKLRRLPHPCLWRAIDDDEIRCGIRATSCH